MGKLDIEHLAEGMVLEDPVKDLHGRILMKEGSVMTEKTIRILKMWGVVEVTVVNPGAGGQEAQMPVSVDPEILRLAETETKALFRHVSGQDPFVEELFRLASLRIAKARMKGAEHVH